MTRAMSSRAAKGTAIRFLGVAAGLVGLVTMACILTGQAAKPDQQGIPTDWSHRHVIFSQPATAEQAARLANDPRYWQQWYRQNGVRLPPSDTTRSSEQVPLDLASLGNRYPNPHPDWSEDLGSGGTVGASNYPAKYSFQIGNANCGNAATPDYVVFSTGLAGASGQASVVAYDNLYSGCTGTVPSVYWAYNTGGQVLTSPIISGDGTQVAFVQTSGGFGSLVLVKWAASTTESVTSPMTLTSSGSYRSCPAPCMTEINLVNGSLAQVNDVTSSVFPDYHDDIIWVGGAGGWLHKITGVFHGNPAEVTAGGFPVQLNSANSLSSPVYDGTANVFVGDSGGFLYRVSASAGTFTASGRVDHGVGLVAAPVVDATAGKIYVFSSDDGSTTCTGGVPCSAVYVFASNFASGNSGAEVAVGTSSATPNPFYEGAFDSTYFASINGTGNLYVCGGTAADPILYRVPIAAGVFGTVAAVATLTPAADHPACSPVTDFSNPNATGGGEERLFFSVQDFAHPTICAAKGCALSFVDSPWKASTAYAVGQEVLVLRTANNTLYIDVATQAGTTGATAPTWPNAIGTVTVDGTVHWLNQGATTVSALGNWKADNAYALRARIVDSKGNVEVVSTAGTSGGTTPTWSTTAGANTTDGTVTWVNAGVLPSAALPETGGTSGFIIDNTSSLAGASQVYFSTLGNQACTGGTGVCAVQASQSALQ